MIAGTPALTAEINAWIKDSAGVSDLFAGLATTESAEHMRDTTCELGLATDGFVSWRCSMIGSDGPMTGGGFRQVWTSNHYIDKGQLRPATLDNILGTKPDRDKRLEAMGGTCAIDIATDIWEVTFEGIAFGAADSGQTCALSWETLTPLLVADNPSKRISKDDPNVEQTSRRLEWDTAPPRFISTTEPDAVLDTATKLENDRTIRVPAGHEVSHPVYADP